MLPHADKNNYPHILGNSEGSGAKSWLTTSSCGENIYAFPHILGSPSSYMTLHPIPSVFPHVWGIFFSFLSVHLQVAVGKLAVLQVLFNNKNFIVRMLKGSLDIVRITKSKQKEFFVLKKIVQ